MKLTALYQWARIFLIGFILSSSLGCAAIPAAPLATRTPVPTASLTPPGTITPTSRPTLPPIPTPALNDPAAVSLTGICRSTMDGLAALTQGLKLPDHFYTGSKMRQPGDFDPNDYFKVLTHLKMAPGYTLDYVYYADSRSGQPILYARDVNNPPFENYEAWLQSYGKTSSDESPYKTPNHIYDYIEKIQPDQSPEGYFQFLTLLALGGQFYLSWHANYNDLKIFCAASDLDTIIWDTRAAPGPDPITIPHEILDRAAEIDFQPVALVKGNTITFRYVVFSKWGGFREIIPVLDKQNPTKSISGDSNLLIEYNCAIMF